MLGRWTGQPPQPSLGLGSRRGGYLSSLLLAKNRLVWVNKLTLATLSLFLTGCASVSIVSVSENRSLKPTSPVQTLHVEEISSLDKSVVSAGGTLYLDEANRHLHTGKNRPVPASSVSHGISSSMKKTWSRILGSLGSDKNLTVSDPGLLVTAQTWREEKGSRLSRTLVGLGSGQSKLDAKFYVFNARKSTSAPWLTIHTSGGSGREPGILFALAPSPYLPLNIINWSGVLVSTAGHGFKGLDQDATRTGKMVALCIAERLPGPRTSSPPKTRGHISLPTHSSRTKLPMSSHHQTGMNASATRFIATE